MSVWARVIAKRRLAREVGSEEKKEEGLSQQPALDGGSLTHVRCCHWRLLGSNNIMMSDNMLEDMLPLGQCFHPKEKYSPTGHAIIPTTTSIEMILENQEIMQLVQESPSGPTRGERHQKCSGTCFANS